MSIATVLGFDYGEKRIGIATGQTITGNASPLETITAINQKPDWQKNIFDLINRMREAGKRLVFTSNLPPNEMDIILEDLRSRLNWGDRKSTRLNSSHITISYAVFCLKKKKKKITRRDTL